jgi:hypothetical protein
MRQRICPICIILQSKTNDLLCSLQSEAVYNEEINELVLSTGGYCHFHFWYLERLTNPVTNAQLLQNLLRKVETEFVNNSHANAARPSDELSSCSVCVACAEWQEATLVYFVDKLSDPDFRASHEESRGLCFPHLASLMGRVPDPETRAFLVNTNRKHTEALLRDLKVLIEKWRRTDHSRGEESDSAYRGIAMMVGGKYYRAR